MNFRFCEKEKRQKEKENLEEKNEK